MRWISFRLVLLTAAIAMAAACVPSQSRSPSPGGPGGPGAADQPRTMDLPPGEEELASKNFPVGDPCVERLHDLSGLLLVYVKMHKQLPETLDDLAELAKTYNIKMPPLQCPVSGKAYIYVQEGFPAPQSPILLQVDRAIRYDLGRVFIYDPAPSHGGMRAAVTLSETDSGPMAKVIGLRERDLPKR